MKAGFPIPLTFKKNWQWIKSHPPLPALSMGLMAAGALILLAAGLAYAHTPAKPAPQASPLHPTFALLDADGQNVLDSSGPVSPMNTCGQCHDSAYIASHSFHADLGASETTPPGPWNPLTYRYLLPNGTTATWVQENARRLVGGGLAEPLGVEMDCFLCHTASPNHSARTAALQNGQFDWAATATLLGSGWVEQSGSSYTWQNAAFDNAGLLLTPGIQDPANANCAQCHGLAHSDSAAALTLVGCSLDEWQTATTGQVIANQRISLSGMNLTGKSDLTRSWDVHAERGLTCTDCHYALNNPVTYQSSTRPDHLQFDPRRLEIGEYLQRPNHNFARGQSAQTNLAPELKGTMRRCEACHDASGHSTWLPYSERHMAEIACETCHIPQLYAPAVQSYDWTTLQTDGQPLNDCRGVEGEGNSLQNLVTGYQPVLLPRRDIDGRMMLAPYNLITTWYWVDGPQADPRPVAMDKLQAAWLEGDGYATAVLQGLDADGDGVLSTAELRLDSPEKQALIAKRLQTLGLENPRIAGTIQPYSINHNVTRGAWVPRDCQVCHSDASQLAAPMKLAAYVPGGVLPQFASNTNTLPVGEVMLEDGALVFRPNMAEAGLYVFGHNRVAWVDWFGGLFFVAVLAGVAGHGGLRLYQALRRPRHKATLKKVYMYTVYERFWHWLQTFTIVLLLLTGLVIHRPDLFGWLSFRYMVTIHSVLAAILVINAALSLFYHLVSGQIRQYIPRPYGFFDQAIVQAKFYLQGIFRQEAHPFAKTTDKKLNPLQQVTYFGILNVLLPLQIITGALMWGVQQLPDVAKMFGGLPFLAPFHSLVAWLFAAFIVGHVYLTTTGHEPLAGIKAMVNGWEDMEASE